MRRLVNVDVGSLERAFGQQCPLPLLAWPGLPCPGWRSYASLGSCYAGQLALWLLGKRDDLFRLVLSVCFEGDMALIVCARPPRPGPLLGTAT